MFSYPILIVDDEMSHNRFVNEDVFMMMMRMMMIKLYK